MPKEFGKKKLFLLQHKNVSPQFDVSGMIYWLFGKPIHAPVKEKIDCPQNSKFPLYQGLKLFCIWKNSYTCICMLYSVSGKVFWSRAKIILYLVKFIFCIFTCICMYVVSGMVFGSRANIILYLVIFCIYTCICMLYSVSGKVFCIKG